MDELIFPPGGCRFNNKGQELNFVWPYTKIVTRTNAIMGWLKGLFTLAVVLSCMYAMLSYGIWVQDHGGVFQHLCKNPYSVMAIIGCISYLSVTDGKVIFAKSFSPFSIYFHTATCVAASFGLFLLEFVYGNFAMQIGIVGWITPVSTVFILKM